MLSIVTDPENLFDYEKGLNKAVETNGAASFYKSTNWTDDYCLAAALLYKATKDASYNTEFNKYELEKIGNYQIKVKDVSENETTYYIKIK